MIIASWKMVKSLRLFVIAKARHSFFNNCAAMEASSRPPEDFVLAFPLCAWRYC
jgi:hypothetical protein